MNQSQLMMQSCAITARGGPRCLTFAPRRLKNLSFLIQIISRTLWISQVQSSGLPSIFLRAQPQPTFYFYDNIFAAFFLASSSPKKEFSRTQMAIGVFYSQVFLKFKTPVSRFREPPILQNFHAGKNVKNKNKQTKKPQGFARFWEAYVTKWWTPRIPGSGGPGFKPRPPRCFLDNKLYSTLSLFTQVYKWVPATYCWGGGRVTLRCTKILSGGGVAILLVMLHAKETGISSGRLGLWLAHVCLYLFTVTFMRFPYCLYSTYWVEMDSVRGDRVVY